MVYRKIAKNEPIRPVVYGICFYFMLAGADSFQIGTIGSVLRLVALVPLALSILDLNDFQLRFSPSMVFQLLFLFLAVISLFYSVNVSKTVTAVKTLALNLFLVFLFGVVEQYNQRELQYMQRAMLIGGWVAILLMFLFSDISEGGRLTLLIGEAAQDPNYINGFFLYTFSWHSSKLLLEKKRLHIIPVLFIVYVLLLTGSRGALLAFLAVFFVHVCVFLRQTKHMIRNIILFVLIIVVSSVVFDLILVQLPESVSQRFSWDYISENGTTGRTSIWMFFLRLFTDSSIPRMFFGYGYGTTLYLNTAYNRVAHNLYLDDLISVGIIGMLLQIATQWTVFRNLVKYKEYSLLGAYCGMLCMCLSLSLVAYKPIWNIMLLSLAIDFHEKSKLHTSTSPGGITQEVSL